MARAARARAGLTVYPPSRTFEPLAFNEKKAEVSKRQYSSKAKGSNVRDFPAAKNTVVRPYHSSSTRVCVPGVFYKNQRFF